MLKKIAFTALFAATAFASAVGSLQAKDLKVATNPTFPPFEFVNSQTKEFTGFEMDLIKAIGKQAGYNVVIQNMGFDGIIPAILAGNVDVGASGFSITPERAKKVLFTEPFYESGLTILINKSSADKIHGFKDLKGKKIAVQIGTTAAAKAKEIEGAQIVTFNHAGEAILELSNGGADAVINDKPVTDYILVQQPQLAKKTVHLPELLSADPMGIVVAKDNTALQGELNKAMAELKKNGTYAELYKKWFGAHAH